ncbi:MAG: hypothetical protein JSW50_16800 [Candidatus Latescibacterota bacterium]|nr:MAG: hypothetical protein JSW50_16800 [Candidatus Latescibacterota bacterium]
MTTVRPTRVVWILTIVVISGCIVASSAFAGYSRGGSFVAPGYGARAWGMGGAAVAIGSDEGATYWNPALLSLMHRGRLGFTYVDLVPGAEAQQSYLAYARGINHGNADEPGLGFSTHSFGILYGNLSLELSDGQRYTENTLLAGYAYSPDYFWSVGASLGLLLSTGDLGELEAKGTTITVGFRIELLETLTFGAVGRNLFSQIMFDSGENYALQRSLTLGFAYRASEIFVVEADMVGAYGGVARLVLGGEAALFSNRLMLRGGISAVTTGENRSIPHLGIGVKIRRVFVDYNANFDTEEAFDKTHRFSLAIEL